VFRIKNKGKENGGKFLEWGVPRASLLPNPHGGGSGGGGPFLGQYSSILAYFLAWGWVLLDFKRVIQFRIMAIMRSINILKRNF